MLIARFPPTLGGAEIQCSRLSGWLARNGHDVVVLTEKSIPDQPDRERVDGFDVIRFGTWGGLPWSSLGYGIKALSYLLTHKDFDVLHAHMIATPAITASLAGLILKVPVLIKVTGGRRTGDFSTSQSSFLGQVKLWLVKRGHSRVVCPSQETYQEAKSFGIPPERLSYIPNGVDTAYFSPAISLKSRLRSSLQWSESALVAIYVGRWAKGKGVETLLDLWEAGASRPDFPWHLALVLSDPAPEAMAKRIQRLQGRIHTAYGVMDTRPYYQAADLAILLSEGEGLSNFLLEAMSCALPTLTTAAAALPDAEADKTGTHTLPPNAQAATESLTYLTQLAKQINRLATLGEAARRHIDKNYSLDQVGLSYLTLYKNMNCYDKSIHG